MLVKNSEEEKYTQRLNIISGQQFQLHASSSSNKQAVKYLLCVIDVYNKYT